MERRAGGCRCGDFLSFLGGGAYPHIIPTVVDYLAGRGEFISPYTPYQPEVSQGTLQIIFEFQTLISQLTGMEIANASLYDGASGAAEAVLMANRVKRRKKVLVPASLHPHYRRVIDTYTRNLDIAVESVAVEDSTGRMDMVDLSRKIDGDTAAVLCQTPNYFGVIEDFRSVAEIAHGKEALAIAVISEAMSMGMLTPPGEQGADIVTGEAQSFGIPLSFGGPYLGFMATAERYIRQFPGRIAGQTRDVDGKRGFVLTLSTREQHIRRERATSNICTNQAHCALRAAIYLETLGPDGLKELARLNMLKARYAADQLGNVDGIRLRYSGPFFNEFTLRFERAGEGIADSLKNKGILAGIRLKNDFPDMPDCVLMCVTETHSRRDIDRLAESLQEELKA